MGKRIEYNLEAAEVDRRIREAAEALKMDEAVLAFYLKDMRERKLYIEFGCSSTVHYAETVCGFSDRKTRYLLFIGEKLDCFRKIRESFMDGRIGWTKVRELLKIVTPGTEVELLELAVKLTNRKLEALVALKKEERAAIKRDALTRATIAADKSASRPKPGPSHPSNGSSTPNSAGGINHSRSVGYGDLQQKTGGASLEHVFRADAVCVEEPKLGVTLNFTPEEHVLFTRFLVEWRKRNPDIRKREEAIIRLAREYMDSVPQDKSAAGLEAADEMKESRITVVEPPYEVVIHHCPECGRSKMVTDRGEIAAGKPLLEQALCDGAVYEQAGKISAGHDDAGVKAGCAGTGKGAVIVSAGKDADLAALPGRKRKAVPPALRKRIILRDRGRCSTPGCRHEKYLEIHHIVPTSKGGTNEPSNLLTTCGRCHKNIHIGKLKIRGAYPDIEFFRGIPGGAKVPFGPLFHSRQDGETARVKEPASTWKYSRSVAA